MWLFLAFLIVPLIEIALFIQVGGAIGLWSTLAIVVLTAIVGTWLVRSQGIMALNNLRNSMSGMQDPSEALVHGAMILFAGALLLTPGFFTDAVGFALMVPALRSTLFRAIAARIQVHSFSAGPQPRRPQPDVIDGEFVEIEPGKKPNHPGSDRTKH